MADGNTEEEMLQMTEADDAEEAEEEPEEAEDVTEYERARLERVKRNRDMLSNLQVHKIATALQPVFKKPRTQSVKGKEKLDSSDVYQRRTTRLSTRAKRPSKIVDWASDSSEEPSESDSGGAFFPKGKEIKKKRTGRKLNEEIEEDEVEKKKDDDEYEPSGGSESEGEAEEAYEPEDDENLQLSVKKVRGKRSREVSGKRTDVAKKRPRLKALSSTLGSPKVSDPDGDTDLDFEQAIQMSMRQGDEEEESLKSPGAKSEGKAAGPSKPRKRKNARDLNFTMSEVDAYFSAIVGNCQGALSLQHLENAAISHDFLWSEEDIQDMIDVFDENDDGFLSLTEFRTMAARCKMMETS